MITTILEPLDLAGRTDLLFAVDAHNSDAIYGHLSAQSCLCAILAGFHMSRHYAGRLTPTIWTISGSVYRLGSRQDYDNAICGIG